MGSALFLVVSALTAGAVLRAGGRCFTGWGTRGEPSEQGDGSQPTTGDEQPDTELRQPRGSMYAVIAVLLAGCLAAGVVPTVAASADAAARRFTDTAGYLAAVLTGESAALPVGPGPGWSLLGIALGIAGASAATGVAAAGLRTPHIGSAWRRAAAAVSRPAVTALRNVHSGHVGDYVAWMFTALATLAAVLGLQLR